MSASGPAGPGAAPSRRRRRLRFVAVALAAVAAILLVDVSVIGPRVHVRWVAGLDDGSRAALERVHGLSDGQPVSGSLRTWRYELDDDSPENIDALLRDRRVEDTAYIDPRTLSPQDSSRIEIEIGYPFSDVLTSPRQLWQMQASLWTIAAGLLALWGANAADPARRRLIGVGVAAVAVLAIALPLDPSFVTMGGSDDHIASRSDFEGWFAGRVRFEKHLAQVTLLQIYQRLAPTEAAPEQALVIVTRIATVWFLVSALTVGFVERWSAAVLRYLGLVLLAPATLLYFGWRELGYLSLTVAAFPLVLRGLTQQDRHLEAGSAFAGIGAAFHGSGLVGLAGIWLAIAAAPGAPSARAARVLRSVAYGTAAYLGWIAFYIIVLKLGVLPDPGPTAVKSWRALFVDVETAGRMIPAIVSALGARDVLMSAWVAGVPLLAVALARWRHDALPVRTALACLPPSLLFLVFRAPFDGIGVGVDLVVAGFPALFALAWVCAQERKSAITAAGLLLSAHYAFWRIVLDERFQP